MIINENKKNTFTFTDKELSIINACLYYQACDGEDMKSEYYKTLRTMADKLMKVPIPLIEVWE